MSSGRDNQPEFTERIVQKIRLEGPIPFAQFMEMALYSPQGGYYTSSRAGRDVPFVADYATSPMTHPVFGALIACQLQEMQRICGAPRFNVVELGAGNGTLANDIAQYAARHIPELHRSMEYKAYDRKRCNAAGHEVGSIEDLNGGQTKANCVISNELIDALCTHRFVVRQGEVMELYVGERQGKLVEVEERPSTPAIGRALSRYLPNLPEGYRGEVNLQLGPWVESVSKLIECGYVISIDYGFEADLLYSPSFNRGSVLSYRAHSANADPLADVGGQDITSSVNFTMLEDAFKVNGFDLVGYRSQADFLENLGVLHWLGKLQAMNMAQRDKIANLAGIRKLTDPGGLGGFRVYIHSRGVPDAPLSGMNGRSGRERAAHKYPPPLIQDYAERPYAQDAWTGFSSYNIPAGMAF